MRALGSGRGAGLDAREACMMEAMSSLMAGAASLGAPAASLVCGAAVAWGAWRRWGARIYARERPFEMSSPFPLGGRPDLVMQEWGGALVIHDLKTRKNERVYDSDRLQLALYALLVRKATGRSVAPWAVVRVQVPGAKAKLVKIPLDIPAEDLAALHARFSAVAVSPLAAGMTAAPSLCRHCGFRPKHCQGR